MKSFLIDGVSKQITKIDVTDRTEITAEIGFSTLAYDFIAESEILVFDEDCFICGSEGRYQIDSPTPIAGKAVIVGLVGSDLVDSDLADSKLTITDISSRVKFL